MLKSCLDAQEQKLTKKNTWWKLETSTPLPDSKYTSDRLDRGSKMHHLHNAG